MKTYPHHPFADIFPIRDGQSLTELRDHMKAHGQKERIVLFEDQVLAGRRRQLAAIAGGLEPLYREFGSRPEDGDDPLEYAFTDFFRRDDMTPAEKSIAAANYAKLKKGDNQHKQKEVGPNGPTTSAGQKEAAKKFGVPVRTIKRAKVILEKGCPELQDAYRKGEVSVSDAASIAGESHVVQLCALEAVKKGTAKTLREAVARGNPPPAENAKKIGAALELLIERLTRVETKETKARTLAVQGLRAARALIAKL